MSLACQQAAGGYPPEIVDDKSRFILDGIQMEVDGEGRATGKFRSKSLPVSVFKPGGGWPEQWGEHTHKLEGHGLDADSEDRTG